QGDLPLQNGLALDNIRPYTTEDQGGTAMKRSKANGPAGYFPGFEEPLASVTPQAAGKRPAPEYQPLASIWEGSDADLLEQMLDFYPHKKPRRILDATVNAGRFWVGSKRKVIGLDIDARHHPTVVGDNMQMPFKDACFDVVVYDPPHIPNQGKDKAKD